MTQIDYKALLDKEIDRGSFKDEITRDMQRLLAVPCAAFVDPSTMAETIPKLVGYCTVADRLAQSSRKRYVRDIRWIYSLAAVAGIVAVISLFVHENVEWVLLSLGLLPARVKLGLHILEFVALLLVSILVGQDRQSKVHGLWINLRLLAERLRTCIFVTTSGMTLTVNSWLVAHRREIARYSEAEVAFRAILGECAGRPDTPEPPDGDRPHSFSPTDPKTTGSHLWKWKSFLTCMWVNSQQQYHVDNAAAAGILSRRYGLLAQGTFVGDMCLVGVLVIHSVVSLLERATEGSGDTLTFTGFLQWLTLLLPVVGAALIGYRSHREFERIADRSASMVSTLDVMKNKLMEASNTEELKIVVSQIGDAMVDEATDWCVLMKSLDVRLP